MCNSYTTKNKTDILLNDRYSEYNSNNYSLCENNCVFINYAKDTENVECECKIKISDINLSEINSTNAFYYNFSKSDLSTNMVSMKCVYTLFTKDGIYKNIANYILILFIIFFLMSAILFHKCGFYLLEDDMKEIIEIKKENKKNININETNENVHKKENFGKKKKSKKKKRKSNKLKVKVMKGINVDKNNSLSLKSDSKDNNKLIESIDMNKNNNSQVNYTDYELNSFSYMQSIKYDKRKFYQYYISLIKKKHPIIFSFCPQKDYNSMIIKIDLFLLSFSLYYFINALFFNESLIHKIYEDNGIYHFNYFSLFALYSFIISHAISLVLKHFSLSERNIYEIKNEVMVEKDEDKIWNVRRCLIIKYICFFISGFLFLLFLWYYLSSFGALYQNTQIFLIKNVLITFGFSSIYPFIINIVPVALRQYSLKKTNREFAYKISKIIQYI